MAVNRVTLSAVAKEAGVAVSTASAILRGEKTSWSSQETRYRVFDAAKKVMYRPNEIARSLRSQKSNLIGLAFHSLEMHPLPMAKLAEVERFVIEAGYQVLIRNHHGEGSEEIKDLLADYLSYQVAGIIFMPSHKVASQLKWLVHTGIPAVSMDAIHGNGVPNVTVDRAHGGYLQVKHMIEDAGCRRLAFFIPGSINHPANPAYQKMLGFKRALKECGSSMKEHLWFHDTVDTEFQIGHRAAKELIESDEHFDGIVALSDQVALTALDVVKHSGRRVPEDVAVIGFDDQPFTAHLAVPLTTIRQPRGIGKAAVKMMLELLRKPGKNQRVKDQILQPDLVVRNSTIPSTPGYSVVDHNTSYDRSSLGGPVICPQSSLHQNIEVGDVR